MKLKYKKIILVISIGTLAIGFVTLSISKTNTPTNKMEVTNLANTEDDISESPAIDNIDNKAKDTSENSALADSADSTKTKEEDNNLQKDIYPEINELVKNYLAALVKCDMDDLSKYVTDTNTIDLETLQKKSEYIEDYKNIECYTIKGKQDGSYVVYVYEELKIIGIDTPAPGMIRLYVTTADDGKLYITTGTIDDETNDYINSTSKDQKVQKLIQSVNLKLTEAEASDTDLKDFINQIDEITEKADDSISESENTN